MNRHRKQRIIIAILLGWKNVAFRWKDGSDNFGEDVYGDPPDGITNSRAPYWPDDLNAMHRAWLSLDEQKQWEFGGILMDIVEREFPDADLNRRMAIAINAPAKFRSEAFIRLHDKWEEEMKL